MTLNDLVTQVATEAGVTKKVAKAVIDSTFEKIGTAVKSGDQILIPQLGRFNSKARKERKATNLTTGEALIVPAKKVPTFSYAKNIKDATAELPLES